MMKRTLPVSTYFCFDRVEGGDGEMRAVWAGQRHVFDDLDRSVFLAERNFRQGAGLQHFVHVDAAIRRRNFILRRGGGIGGLLGAADRGGIGGRCGVGKGSERQGERRNGGAAQQVAFGQEHVGHRA